MSDYNVMVNKIIEYGKRHAQTDSGYKIFELLRTKWHARILLELFQSGPARFMQIKSAIPNISNAVLASSLHKLEENGLISRTEIKAHPTRVEYSLTECGEGMWPIFEAMMEWESNYVSSQI